MSSIAVIIVAAGRGARASQQGAGPKQYEHIGGAPMLSQVLHTFGALDPINWLQVVIHKDDRELYGQAVHPDFPKLLPPVIGGATRQASVLAGLEALAALRPARVLIHDAARPFASPTEIVLICDALDRAPGAICAVPVADTLKRSDADGTIVDTVDRAGLWAAQTPQGFHFDAILAAHRKAAISGRDNFTDDAAVAEWAGISVQIVEGSTDNMKITTAADLERARARLSVPQALIPRTGLGFDVHSFTAGDHVWLGGVKIPHTHKLEGHSDADVVLHALTDALLGAIGDGDIGQHFPPSDPQWKGAASILFLKDAVRRVGERAMKVVNVDITVLAEAPRIGPHREAMQAVISTALGILPQDVGIKATTTESLGFVGRREGLAAMAVATVVCSIQ